ncbi:hypothetical protein PspKH34_36290 [Parageobacillus sp. KH3-4]|nr:hypothetical protein PspKH34_36290 [Parageobacillus sp. KH3-4]
MGACHMVKGYFVKEVMETCKKQLAAKPSWNTSTTAQALSAPYRLIAKKFTKNLAGEYSLEPIIEARG